MIEVLPECNGNLLAVRAVGKLTRRDYREEIIPRFKAIFRDHGKARFLLEDFNGWEVAALWEDARFGLAHRRSFEKIAVVGAPAWVEFNLRLIALIIEGEVRMFPPSERSEAFSWITS
jgi:hypothetical protein